MGPGLRSRLAMGSSAGDAIESLTENAGEDAIVRKPIALLTAALAVLTFAGKVDAEPLKIRMSYIQPVSNWATMLFQTPGLAKHLNQSYTFEATRFQGTPLLVQALAANEIEIGNFGFTAFSIAVINAKLQDVR